MKVINVSYMYKFYNSTAIAGTNYLSRQLVAWMMLLHGRSVSIILMHSLSTRSYGL